VKLPVVRFRKSPAEAVKEQAFDVKLLGFQKVILGGPYCFSSTGECIPLA
jgi:hypothetical protein